MPTVIVTSQSEWDALPAQFRDYTIIAVKSPAIRWITIKDTPENSRVEARESSRVEARESSRVEARESSRVEAWGSSRVEAWGSSSVVARGSSRVEARESSRVVARESSSVVAWESSSVVARESSSVVAWESSSVVARGSSRVEAWGSSRVVARGSSRVVARGQVSVHHYSSIAPNLYGQSVCFVYDKAKAPKKKSKTATTRAVAEKKGTLGWLETEGVIASRGSVVLYKRVSADWLTQENTSNQTEWKLKTTVEHPAWDPKHEECGSGKFHACSTPYFCDEFRSEPTDKYVAIEIKTKDLYAWPNPSYPHKIAFRAGKVLYEVDRWGIKL